MNTPNLSEYNIEARVQQARVDVLYKQTLSTSVGAFLCGLILLFGVWDFFPASVMWAWASCLWMMQIFRLVVWIWYRRAQHRYSVAHWERWFSVAILVGALVWGSAGILFSTREFLATVHVGEMLVILSAGSVLATVTQLKTQRVFILLVLVPYCVSALVQSNPSIRLFALAVIVFGTYVWFTGRNIYYVTLDTLRLRFQKEALSFELAAQKDKAIAADRAKTQFLAAASHDLRQPMHALALFGAALQREPIGENARELVTHMNHAVGTLTGLFDAILDISKVDAGLVTPCLRAVDLNALFARVVRTHLAAAHAKGLHLRHVSTRQWIHSDELLLERILGNVVANAVNYTFAGGILLGCRRQGNHLSIQVIDSGIGIAPEQQTRVFEEFYQVDNPARDRSKGLGLGLAIVKRIAGVLDMPFELQSRPGQGTRMQFKVGVTQKPQNDIENLTAAPIHEHALAGVAVLLMEDDILVCRALASLMTSWGCQVMSAGSAYEAIQKIRQEDFVPQLVIQDYRLRQGETAVQAYPQICAALGRRVPAIVVTGDVGTDVLKVIHSLDLPVLHKPVLPDLLKAQMAALWVGTTAQEISSSSSTSSFQHAAPA